MPLLQSLLSNIELQSLENFECYINCSSTFLIDCLINYIRQQTAVLCELIISVHLGAYASWKNFRQTLPTLLLSPSLLGPDCTWNRLEKILTIAITIRMQQTYKNSMAEISFNFQPFSLTFSSSTLPCQLKLLLDEGCIYSDRTRRISRKYQQQNQKYTDNPAPWCCVMSV